MKLKYLSKVSTIQVDPEKCIGCGMCLEVCPHGVLRLEEGGIVLADHDACMECGACAKNCPVSAIRMTPGVGCAAAIITGWIRRTEPTCGCSAGSAGGCC